MAEEFEAAGTCGGNYWWNMNNTCSSSSPLCSIAANNDGANYFISTWQTHNLMDHHDSLGFLVHDQKQNLNQNGSSSPSSASENNRNVVMDSTLLGFALPPSSNWNNNHSLLGRPEDNYQSVIEEEGGGDSSNSAEMRTTNQEFAAIEQQNLSYGLCVEEHNIIPLQFQPDQGSLFTNPSLVASSYNNSTNQVSPAESWSKASPDHFLKPSSMPIIKHHLSGLHFSNYASPDDQALNDVLAPHGFASSPLSQTFQQKPSFPVALLTKHKREEVPVSEGATAFKRPRIETPSPLPTFKVRKEKLGDRITALQQLVSPFGKTDTASVLHEAIEYIKYLHDQVSVLSAPYMNNNNGQPYQGCDEKESKGAMQDLRSQGLCLAPISSTFSLANHEMTMAATDFWTHAYGGALMR